MTKFRIQIKKAVLLCALTTTTVPALALSATYETTGWFWCQYSLHSAGSCMVDGQFEAESCDQAFEQLSKDRCCENASARKISFQQTSCKQIENKDKKNEL